MDIAAETARGWPEKRVVGVDEAGRGPWAGPVVAAAVYLPADYEARGLVGLNDSKKLSEKKREALFELICTLPSGIGVGIGVGIGIAEVEEIDTLNILQASMQAMHRAVSALPFTPDFVLVDGNRLPAWDVPSDFLIGGDARSVSIAAASIVAKVTRDRMMVALDAEFPGYGWAGNKGYGVKMHQEGLARLGVTPHHRRSFAPIRKMLSRNAV
ncbi:MAG TPA: ribonuclease HII [Rhodobiaceae bacterium]|nr:ribonuclease HII [Rhodobiaceae bacterium]